VIKYQVAPKMILCLEILPFREGMAQPLIQYREALVLILIYTTTKVRIREDLNLATIQELAAELRPVEASSPLQVRDSCQVWLVHTSCCYRLTVHMGFLRH
jgi:hypothetical protein